MSKIIVSLVCGAVVTIGVTIGAKFLIMLGLNVDPNMIWKIATPIVFFGSSVGFYVMGIIYNDEIQN